MIFNANFLGGIFVMSSLKGFLAPCLFCIAHIWISERQKTFGRGMPRVLFLTSLYHKITKGRRPHHAEQAILYHSTTFFGVERPLAGKEA